MNDKYKYLGKNTLIFGISSFGTGFLSFLLIPLYTNILTTEEYGAANLITTTGTLLIFILTINISDSVLRFSIERKTAHADILSYGIRVLIIGSLICLLGLSAVYLSGILKWPFYYYLFILLFFSATALYQILTNYLRGTDRVTQVAIAGIISTFTIIVSNIVSLIVLRIGIIGYLISMILGPFTASIFCVIVIKEPLSIYLKNSCDSLTMQEMRTYCIPLIFNNVALWINAFIDRYFITAYCGLSETGIYSVANKIPAILTTCYTVFSQAWNLSAIKEFDPKDRDGFFSKTYSTYNALITIICSILILLNIPLAKFFYSKGFFSAWRYSAILLLSVMFNSLTIILGGIFSAVKKTQTIAFTTIFSALANTILNLILIPAWGALGASISTTIAYLAMWIIRIVLVRKYIKLQLDWRRDCLCYGIISAQIVFELLTPTSYWKQIACLCIIIFLYSRQIGVFFKQITHMISVRKNK